MPKRSFETRRIGDVAILGIRAEEQSGERSMRCTSFFFFFLLMFLLRKLNAEARLIASNFTCGGSEGTVRQVFCCVRLPCPHCEESNKNVRDAIQQANYLQPVIGSLLHPKR